MSGDPKPIRDAVERIVDLRAKQPERAAPVVSLVEAVTGFDVAAFERERVERRWEQLIPQRFRSARIAGLVDDVRDLVAQWVESDPRPNMLIVGAVGTGKTHAAAAAVRPFVERDRSVEFVSVLDLLDTLRSEMEPGVPRSGLIERLGDVDVLVLDDIGAERATEWAGERLHALIDRRWRTERETIATTNLEPQDLAAVLGERTYSRLVRGAIAVRISGVDRRRRPTRKQES